MLALLTLSTALAAQQSLVYDLSVNGAKVGTREVTVRYLDRPGGERRIVESVTAVSFAGQVLSCRAVGQSSSRVATFSSQSELNGRRAQYQGVQVPGTGWELTIAGGNGVQTERLAGAQTVLTSLDLVDPGRTDLLGAGGRASLFFVETADVVTGTLTGGVDPDDGGGGDTKVTVGGKSIAATEYTLKVDGGGDARFAIDGDGLLLRSEVTWLGVRVVAALRAMPEERGFGTIELDGFGATVSEQGL